MCVEEEGRYPQMGVVGTQVAICIVRRSPQSRKQQHQLPLSGCAGLLKDEFNLASGRFHGNTELFCSFRDRFAKEEPLAEQEF